MKTRITSKEQMRTIKKGQAFFVNKKLHIASSDSHLSGDASYDGYIVYDENNNGWLEEDFK